MLMLAGLMGLMLVGSAALALDPGAGVADDEAENEGFAPGDTGAPRAGSDLAEFMFGSAGVDQINGYGGEDSLLGGAGGDLLHGSGGDDRLSGGGDGDALRGGAGADLLYGGAGNDTLWGEEGRDFLAGGADEDSLLGGGGDDSLSGGEGRDVLGGGLGADRLDGGAGGDSLFGGHGADWLTGVERGAPDADFLNGGGGDDSIVAGDGDIVTGGAGADTSWTETHAGAETGTESAVWTDFDPAEDSLVLVHEGPRPEIGLRDTGDGIEVLADGAVVLRLPASAADLDPDEIRLVARAGAEGDGAAPG